jgi:hypothetical protein
LPGSPAVNRHFSADTSVDIFGLIPFDFEAAKRRVEMNFS